MHAPTASATDYETSPRAFWRMVRHSRAAAALVVLTSISAVTTSGGAQQTRSDATARVDSARTALSRGAIDDALQWFDRALAADSTNTTALRESAKILAEQGRWPEARPRLATLVRLGPVDAPLLYSYGLWTTWSGQSDSGATLMRRAIQQQPDSTAWRVTLAQALTWNPRTRPEGVRVLRDLQVEQPQDVEIRRSLAAALTWDPTTRTEGLKYFQLLAADVPTDYDVATDYADALSWAQETRVEALRNYQTVPATSPVYPRATRGRLNLLSWSGNTEEAFALADSLVMAGDTTMTVRKSRGTLLMQLRRRQEGLDALQPVLVKSPADTGLRETVAYALLGEGRNREARQVARLLPVTTAPGAADWVRRGASPSVGIDVLSNATSLGLSSFRLVSVASLPITSRRFTVSGGPVWFSSTGRNFTANVLSASVSGSAGRLRDVRVEGGFEDYSSSRTAWAARADATMGVRKSGELKFTARRSPVEDSPLAASGEIVDGRFTGLVRANAVDVSIRLPDVREAFGLRAAATLANYTGEALESNVRRELSAAVFRPILFGSSRLETALGFTYIDNQYDALDFTRNAPNRRGAYWSPLNFGNSTASASFVSPLTPRLTLSANGLAGWQVMGREPGASQFNVSGGGGLSWIAASGVDLSASYLYLDNLGGFQLRQFRGTFRYSF